MTRPLLTVVLLTMTCLYAHAQGTITSIAGNGITQYIGDGWPATNYSLALPMGLCVDAAGNVYEADYAVARVRRVDAHDTIITYAGTGTMGYSGDGGLATAAMLQDPTDVTLDAAGNLYVVEEYNNVVRRIDAATHVITTVCGSGVGGFAGDGGPALAARISQPAAICIDKDGNLYISDKGNQRIRKVAAGTGIITTVAGTGTPGFNNDDIPATAAMLSYPAGICADTAGNIYVADNGNNMVRRIGTDGLIKHVAGTGAADFNGNDIAAAVAALAEPMDVFMSSRDNLYIADRGNNMVRVITKDGIIHTLAGSGLYGYAGDGGPAKAATFIGPTAVCADGDEYVYIADGGNSAIRKVTPVYNSVTSVQSGIRTLHVYPNPTAGVVHIAVPGAGHKQIAITNVTGSVVWTGTTDEQEATADLTGLAAGLYLVQTYSDGARAVARITLVNRN